MARTEHISRLAELELFSSCSKKDLQTIAKSSTEVDVLAGATIVEQGDMGTEAFVILDGEAVVKRNGRKIASLTAGDAIG